MQNFFMFADDLKLYLASKKSVSFNAMQQDIDLLYRRSRSWGLDFSVNKCVHLHFGRSPLNPFIHNFFLGNAFILISESSRDLGVLVLLNSFLYGLRN